MIQREINSFKPNHKLTAFTSGSVTSVTEKLPYKGKAKLNTTGFMFLFMNKYEKHFKGLLRASFVPC